MRWTVLVFAMALGLSACGSSPSNPSTPIGRALAALRSGDRDAFLKAKADADAAKQSAWQIGMDPCKVTGDDFEKHGEAALIDTLDKPDIFRLGEDARFVYAAKITGTVGAAMKAAAEQPTMRSWYNPDFSHTAAATPCMDGFAGAPEATPLADGQPGELERRAVLKDWLDGLVAKYGAAKFDDAMHDAVALLDRTGYTTTWPENIEFVDDPNIKTFGQVQAEIAGADH